MRPATPEEVAGNIKAAREARGLTQAQLAETLGVGQPTVSGWEAKDFAPRRDLWVRLADALDRSIESIFFVTDDDCAASA